MKRFICGLFASIGLLCIIFPGPITVGLPYVLGGAMVLAGILYCIAYFRKGGAWVYSLTRPTVEDFAPRYWVHSCPCRRSI